MSVSLYKYRVRCTTDSVWEHVWMEEGQTPTQCPTDSGHTIDSGLTTITETREDNKIEIKEEAISTGGNAQIQSITVICDATTGWKENTISFPYNISVIDGFWSDKAENEADEAQMLIGEETIVGAITAAVTGGVDDTFTVQQSVIDNIEVGTYVHLDDFTNKDDCGRVLSVNKTNLTITCETIPTNDFSPATPTYVKMTTKMVPHLELTGVGAVYNVTGGVGAAHIPANTVIKVRYNNKSGTAKRFVATFEYFY